MKDYRKVSELKLWEQNPRSIKEKDFERLKKQIKELGQYKPLLITKEGEVIGGNMRLRAYRDLGIEEVWVSVVNPKNEAEKLAYALSDNDRAGYYDDDLLSNLSSAYPDFDWSGYAVDLNPPETLDKVLMDINEVQEDEVPEVSDDPVSRLGEVYQLGKHRLMCGDSTKIEDVEKLMNGQKADMVFTDPPYNVDYGTFKGEKFVERKIINDSMTGEEYTQFCSDFSVNLGVFCDGCMYICHAPNQDGRILATILDNMFHCSTTIIWNKDTFTLGRGKYQNKYEPIWFGWNKEGSGFTNENRDITNVWDLSRPKSSKEHPTMKPIELCARAINDASKKDGSVLDLFGGSGSTLIACEQLNRTCFMMELDPKYVDVIRKRYAKFIGKEEEWEKLSPKI